MARLDIRWVVAFLLLAGAGLRGWHYLGDRSFWLDELFLALNLRSRTLAGLAAPLDWDQMAPLGFLWIEKAAFLAFGDSERALRLPALIASLATLTVSYPVARQVLDRAGATLALALCALLPGSIYFAAELKQYAFDEFAAVTLTGLALACARTGTPSVKAALAIAGLLMPWLSHPSVFVLAGAGSSLFLKAWLESARRWAAGIALISSAWVASFVLHLVHSGALGSATAVAMRQFWTFLFMPSPLALKDWLEWMLDWGTKAFGFVQPFGIRQSLDASLLGLVLTMLGVFALMRRPWLIVLLLGPLLAALLASALHFYPFASRFLFFFSPALGILVAAGVLALRGLPPFGALASFLTASLLLGAYVPDTLRHSMHSPPFVHEDTRTLWDAVRRGLEPGDTLYVSAKAIPSFHYYAPDLRTSAVEVIYGAPAGRDWRFLHDAPKIARHRRIWLVYSHLRPDLVGAREDLLMLEVLGKHTRHLGTDSGDAALYLIEFPVTRDLAN